MEEQKPERTTIKGKGPVLFLQALPLVPVGIEWDGRILPIAELSPRSDPQADQPTIVEG